MPDKQNEEFDFIKEKIKHKPVNKKRLAGQVLKSAGLGVVFGFVACLVFTLMQPVLEEVLYEEEPPVVTIPWADNDTEEDSGLYPKETEETEQTATELVTEDETVSELPTEQQDSEMPTEQENQTITQIIEKELELADYQKLQNKLYDIGTAANRSIVTVTGVKSGMDWFNTPYETAGQASGIIIANNGRELLIMTEKKVITDARIISVTFVNGTVTTASIKKYDGNTGIAILCVSLTGLKEADTAAIDVARFGDSYQVVQGDVVIAVGSPLGSNYSILTGNITSVNNTVSTIDSNFTVFTTDIVGSAGGSGALLNLDGEIVGLVMQDYSAKGEENTLTALSISELKEIIEMLSNSRSIGYLGLKISTVTNEIAKNYSLPLGVYIKSVEMDSPAITAGLQSGDVITAIDGNEMLTVEQYEQYVRRLTPGSDVEITIMRQGQEDYVEIKCQAQAGVL